MPNYQTIFDDSAFQKTTASVLPDNSTGQIDAQDVRDMYATLRDRNKVKTYTFSSTASLTIDLSVAPVQTAILKGNIGSVTFTNLPSINLAWPSEDITNANWEKLTSTTVAASNVEDPFGLSTADRLTMIAGTNTRLSQGFNAVAGVAYTFSFYAKMASAAAVGSFDLGFGNAAGSNLNLKDVDGSASATWGFYETTWTADATATRWACIDNRLNTLATDIYVARLGIYATDKTDYVKTTTGPAGEETQVVVKLKQDATGSRTVSWGPRVLWENSATPTLSTTAGAVDAVALTSDDGAWFRATFSGKGWGA